MLSRIAESIFWLNRYAERSAVIVRHVKVNYSISLENNFSDHSYWPQLLAYYGGLNPKEIELATKDLNRAAAFLLVDDSNPFSFKENISKSRMNAKGLQDHISKEVWEQINFLFLTTKSISGNKPNSKTNFQNLIETLDKNIVLYNGLIDLTIARGLSWDFLNLGRFIERTFLTIDWLDLVYQKQNYQFEDNDDVVYWRTFLLMESGYEYYLKNYKNLNSNSNIIQQMILDKDFPQSIYYSISRMKKYILKILEKEKNIDKRMILREFEKINAQIEYADLAHIKKQGLQNYLFNLKSELNNFSQTVHQNFFS